MNYKFFVLLLACSSFFLASYAQRPGAKQSIPGTTVNPNLKPDLSRIKIADTTNIKLTKLYDEFTILKNEFITLKEENKKLNQELSSLETSLNSLSNKTAEIQKDNLALKLQTQSIDKSLADLKKLKPVAYGVCVPQKDPVSGEIKYTLTSSYGISEELYMNSGNITITLNQGIKGEPIVFTSMGLNRYNGDASRKSVTYSVTSDPKQFMFSLYPPFVYPLSFIIYETVK